MTSFKSLYRDFDEDMSPLFDLLESREQMSKKEAGSAVACAACSWLLKIAWQMGMPLKQSRETGFLTLLLAWVGVN